MLCSLISRIKVFLHQRDTFWQTTSQTPGIFINDQTHTQVQVQYDDIRTLASERNDCSYENHDKCFELHVDSVLNNQSQCEHNERGNDTDDCQLPEESTELIAEILTIVFSRVLGVTFFCSHARTSHLTTFPRTHCARTCAFCLVAHRTRTRTSK